MRTGRDPRAPACPRNAPSWRQSAAVAAPSGGGAIRFRIGAATAGLGIVLIAAALGPGTARTAEATLSVVMDKAKLVRYPAKTETVIVGNPVIADVTMLKSSGLVVLTGRGFGETNLVFLDRSGTVLSESNLKVEPSSAYVVVQRGPDRESYACQPRCQPAVSLGDASSFMAETIKNITSRNTIAAGSATH